MSTSFIFTQLVFLVLGDEGSTSHFVISPCGQGPCQPAGGKGEWGGQKATLPYALLRQPGRWQKIQCQTKLQIQGQVQKFNFDYYMRVNILLTGDMAVSERG